VRSVFWLCRGMWIAVLWPTFFIFSALRAEGQDATSTIKNGDTNEIVHALCGKSVALLGEPPIHSFGNTLDFKVQLVRRLVEECQFNAIFFESGIYDYIHIEQAQSSGQNVSDSMISAAIGGLWANREVQALVPFLTERVRAGSLTLGGLDDQLGAGTWASREMTSDLVPPLQGEERSRCASILQRHMLWQYTGEAPYGPADKEKIVGCLTEIQAQLTSSKNKAMSTDRSVVMLDSLQRNLARNFTEDDFTKKEQVLKWDNDRDRSMFLNYEWLRSQLPAKSKIIIWAATIHTAKDLSGIQGFEGRVPLGSYIHQKLKDKAFSLAFSAYSGEYAFVHQPVKRLSDAPPSSLEAEVFAHSDSSTVYLSLEQLGRYNSIEARPLGIDPKAAQWDQVIDGLVVFRHEHAPTWIKPPVQ
jgi:erythromycin esterase-like protein